MRRFILIGIVVLAVAGGVVSFLKYDQWFIFPAKRVFVTAGLTDPNSAQFRNERLTRMGWLCGEINAKNRSGGYTGFKRFVSGSSDDVYLDDVGYIGESTNSTARIVDSLSKKSEYLRSGIPRHEIDELVNRDVFNAKWKAHCAD